MRTVSFSGGEDGYGYAFDIGLQYIATAHGRRRYWWYRWSSTPVDDDEVEETYVLGAHRTKRHCFDWKMTIEELSALVRLEQGSGVLSALAAL